MLLLLLVSSVLWTDYISCTLIVHLYIPGGLFLHGRALRTAGIQGGERCGKKFSLPKAGQGEFVGEQVKHASAIPPMVGWIRSSPGTRYALT